MRRLLFLLLTFVFVSSLGQSVDPSKIDIVRDQFGVPHIFAPTDAGVAYGLAWAHAEDDFATIQKGFLAGKSMLGRYAGKEGATVDYIVHLLQCRKIVEERYDTDVSPEYKKVLQGYMDGLNAYAQAHPKEVLVKKLFPITPKEGLAYSVLQLAISSGVDGALQRINNGTIALAQWKPDGSNAYAFNSRKTSDGNVYLGINSHQPLEGPVAWYEAHLCSEEGWNILGAMFPGAPEVFLGCNEYLGWAHTVNYPDRLDVYQLELNPQNPLQYRFDGQWETLQEQTVKLKVKVMGITLSVKKKIYESKYGPTMVTPRGTFSIRTGALLDIRGLEQWYRMNKARNFTEFPDLPGTELEVKAIEKLLSNKVKVSVKIHDNASEEAIKKSASTDILHIATHGFFFSEANTDPMLTSGLLFSGVTEKNNQRADDGILTAYEATFLNLSNTKLAVLSACETGLGEIKNGEGVYGLQRAFEIAGVRNILMSLWKIDDAATVALMEEFYKELLESHNANAALKKAQDKMRQTPEYKQPYYWGAFKLVGD